MSRLIRSASSTSMMPNPPPPGTSPKDSKSSLWALVPVHCAVDDPKQLGRRDRVLRQGHDENVHARLPCGRGRWRDAAPAPQVGASLAIWHRAVPMKAALLTEYGRPLEVEDVT